MIQTGTLSNFPHQVMGHSHGQVLAAVDVLYRQQDEDEARADMNEANYTPKKNTTTMVYSTDSLPWRRLFQIMSVLS